MGTLGLTGEISIDSRVAELTVMVARLDSSWLREHHTWALPTALARARPLVALSKATLVSSLENQATSLVRSKVPPSE
jgi:hypothetical protein